MCTVRNENAFFPDARLSRMHLLCIVQTALFKQWSVVHDKQRKRSRGLLSVIGRDTLPYNMAIVPDVILLCAVMTQCSMKRSDFSVFLNP